MARRIIITAGHNGLGTGAKSEWLDEGAETIVLRDLITEKLRERGVTVYNDPNALPLRGVIAWIRRQFKAKDILVEIHFNAGPPTAKGTECFVENNFTKEEYNLANLLCRTTVNATKGAIQNRGVKTAKDSQHSRLGILEDTTTTSVLWEVCFLSNKPEVFNYVFNREKMATQVADLLTLAQ